MQAPSRSVLFGVALVALGTLLLEVDITRIYAVTLWYYFGFVAISLALLGTGAAGILCYVRPALWQDERHQERMGWAALGFGLLTPTVIAIHLGTDLSALSLQTDAFLWVLGSQLLLFFLVFFCAGLAISIALFRYDHDIGRVYAYDLIGAATGCVVVILLLYHISAPAAVLAVSTAAFAAATLFLWEHSTRLKRHALIGLTLLAAVLTGVNDRLGLLEIQSIKSYTATGLQDREDGLVYEQWSPVSRIAVFEPVRSKRTERMPVTNDGGAPTSFWRFDGDWRNADWVLSMPSHMAFHLRPEAESLIIGSAGGADVLAALRFGNRKVTAVEINPVTAELVQGRFADYIGNIFADPRVTLHVQEGRNFAAGSPDRYDVIKATMIDSWAGAAAGAYLFSENNLYTQEAVRDFYAHLKDDGILSISRYYVWDEALRIANTYLDHLHMLGISDPAERIVIVVEDRKGYRRATLLLKRGLFTADEVAIVARVSAENGFTILHAPGMSTQNFEPGPYADFFRNVLHMPKAERDQVLARELRDVTPATDDKPFFFFMERLERLFAHDVEAEHPARRLAIPILFGAFGFFGVLALLTILGPLLLSRSSQDGLNSPHRGKLLLYFAGLGLGFILVEISLIHRLTVFLGHPIYSFVVVLATLLLASGIGSYLMHRYGPRLKPRQIPYLLMGVTACVLLLAGLAYDQLIELMWLPFWLRVVTSVVLLVPVGLLLGTCFPAGIGVARTLHPRLIPWGWAINGVFSVFASAASLVIALTLGLKAMLLVGAACYLMNALLMVRLTASVAAQETAPQAA